MIAPALAATLFPMTAGGRLAAGVTDLGLAAETLLLALWLGRGAHLAALARFRRWYLGYLFSFAVTCALGGSLHLLGDESLALAAATFVTMGAIGLCLWNAGAELLWLRRTRWVLTASAAEYALYIGAGAFAYFGLRAEPAQVLGIGVVNYTLPGLILVPAFWTARREGRFPALTLALAGQVVLVAAPAVSQLGKGRPGMDLALIHVMNGAAALLQAIAVAHALRPAAGARSVAGSPL